MAFYLGIDSGGTQTTCALADDERELARKSAGSSKIARVGRDVAAQVLRQSILETCAAAGVRPDSLVCACIGAAGVSQAPAAQGLASILHSVVQCPVIVVGDMEIAHEAAFLGGPGMIVIAGTGSIVYGRNERGETARSGGKGPEQSDEGSGEWIGRRAIEKGLLTADLKLKDMAAHLAPEVARKSEQGDTEAKSILLEAGRALARLVEPVYRQLWPGGEAISVALAGGVATQIPIVTEEFRTQVMGRYRSISIREGDIDPVQGAIALARKRHKAPPNYTGAKR